VTQRVGLAALVFVFISVCGFGQSLPDISSVKDLPATMPPSPNTATQPAFHSFAI